MDGLEARLLGQAGVRSRMARRYVHEEPVSQLAIWARRMAFFALAASFLAVIIVRSGLLEIKPAIATFAGALAIAGIALLLGFAALVSIWVSGRAGMGAALAAIAIATLMLGYPAYLGIRAYKLPLDLRHHHRSARSAALRGPGAGTAARRQSGRLCGTVCGRPAAAELSRHRSAHRQRHAAGDLRRRLCGDQQTQVAHRRRARATGRASRRPHRGGGPHARSWASATTSSSASAATATARASTCARRPATAASISAPTRPASAA